MSLLLLLKQPLPLPLTSWMLLLLLPLHPTCGDRSQRQRNGLNVIHVVVDDLRPELGAYGVGDLTAAEMPHSITRHTPLPSPHRQTLRAVILKSCISALTTSSAISA